MNPSYVVCSLNRDGYTFLCLAPTGGELCIESQDMLLDFLEDVEAAWIAHLKNPGGDKFKNHKEIVEKLQHLLVQTGCSIVY